MHDQLATPDDAEREWRWNYGADHPEVAWLCSPRDVVYPNPHYTGPAVPHPDDQDADEELDEFYGQRLNNGSLDDDIPY